MLFANHCHLRKGSILAFTHGIINEFVIITSFPGAFNKNIVNLNSQL